MTRDEVLRQLAAMAIQVMSRIDEPNIATLTEDGRYEYELALQHTARVLDTYRQSIERETIERAAKVAEGPLDLMRTHLVVGYAPYGPEIAEAIRALLPPAGDTKGATR